MPGRDVVGISCKAWVDLVGKVNEPVVACAGTRGMAQVSKL